MSFICTSCSCTGVAMSLLTKEIQGKQNLPALIPNVELKPTLSDKNRVERIDRTFLLERSVEGLQRVSNNLHQDQSGVSPAAGTDKLVLAIDCKQDSDGQKYFEQTLACLEKESSRPPDSILRSSMCSGGHECMYTSTCIGLVIVTLNMWCTECIHT